MRKVTRGSVPADLDGPESSGGKERADVCAFYRERDNREASYKKYSAYKKESVRDALRAMFGDMCAYCEAPYAATTQVDVEHYRPKGGVTGKNGRLVKPGYYWLAATWENLLPSCPDCNREREQKFEDEDSRKAGKANKFPIADERRRATRPGQEGRESPLLLDPCCDDPAKHLAFNDRGNVDPARSRGKPSREGAETIRVCGLDRDGLVRDRRRMLKRMQFPMGLVEEAARKLDARPGDADLEEELREAYAELCSYAAPDHPYSEMARQAIDRFAARLTP